MGLDFCISASQQHGVGGRAGLGGREPLAQCMILSNPFSSLSLRMMVSRGPCQIYESPVLRPPRLPSIFPVSLTTLHHPFLQHTAFGPGRNDSNREHDKSSPPQQTSSFLGSTAWPEARSTVPRKMSQLSLQGSIAPPRLGPAEVPGST